MRYEDLPDHHREFIALVAGGMSAYKAYKQTIAITATEPSARTYGAKLARDYQSFITAERQERQKRVEAAKEPDLLKEVYRKEMTAGELNAALAEIIRAGLKFEDKSPGKPTLAETLKAIELYYKRMDTGTQIESTTSTSTMLLYVPGDPESPYKVEKS